MLGVGVGGAQASPAPCTLATEGCEQPLQNVLGEAPPAQIEVSPDQLTIPGFDYVDPHSTTGADLFDYLEGMDDVGTLDAEGVIALIGPEAVGVTAGTVALPVTAILAGGVVGYYVLHLLWSSQPDTAGTGAAAGVDIGRPVWQHAAHVCSGSPPGWYMTLPGDSGAWSVNSWATKFGTVGGFSSCFLIDPSTVTECANNTQSGGWPIACAVQRGVYNALSAIGQCHDQGSTGDGEAFACYQTDTAAHDDVLNSTTAITAGDSSQNGQGAVVNPPPVTSIDFTRARSDVTKSAAAASTVDAALADNSATVDASKWFYDGSNTVKYGPYTAPQGDTETRIYCEDLNSSTNWSVASSGMILARGDVGGLQVGDTFACYVNAATPDTDGQTEQELADETVQPNPIEFTFGTPYGTEPTTDTSSDGTTGTTDACSTTDPGSIDLTPLEHIPLGSVFPFGVFAWVADGIGGWSSSASAPAFDIPLLGYGVGHPVHVDLSIIDPEMPTIRGVFLILFTVLAFYWLATGVMGMGGGGGGSE
jgi:hypothetical protein